MSRLRFPHIAFVLAVALFALAGLAVAARFNAASPFASTTIDLGTCVSDVEKSVKFYTEAIGFQEVSGFNVSGEFCADAGLTAGKELKIRVLVLGEGAGATKLKLMQVAGADTKKGDSQFVHSQFGYRYITISIADTTAALERLKKAGAQPLAKSPVAIPASVAPGNLYLTVLRDPDGNLVELVGPKP